MSESELEFAEEYVFLKDWAFILKFDGVNVCGPWTKLSGIFVLNASVEGQHHQTNPIPDQNKPQCLINLSDLK